jgi:hypothetical protein
MQIKTALGDIGCKDFHVKNQEGIIYQGNFYISELQTDKLIDYKDVGKISAEGYVDGTVKTFNRLS